MRVCALQFLRDCKLSTNSSRPSSTTAALETIWLLCDTDEEVSRSLGDVHNKRRAIDRQARVRVRALYGPCESNVCHAGVCLYLPHVSMRRPRPIHAPQEWLQILVRIAVARFVPHSKYGVPSGDVAAAVTRPFQAHTQCTALTVHFPSVHC